MRATWRIAMEKMLPGRPSLPKRSHRLFAVGLTLLLALTLSETAFGQIPVSGTVSGRSGGPLPGVVVRVTGSTTRTMTDVNGRYSLTAAPDAVLTFSLVGRRLVSQEVNGRSRIDVTMEPVAYLEEVTVTGYTEQRRADITGAVASVNTETVMRPTTASVLQRLDAAVPGVTVDASGSPGSRSTVRIRGISSFQNNDPLYIVDGTPVQDSYVNFLNPNDITSVQVLKDASAASIYGSRASNGVIVIETTKKGAGGPPRTTLRVRTGVASPIKGYDDFLIQNPLDYFQIIKQSYANAGIALPAGVQAIYGDPNNPSVPKYLFVDAKCSCITASDAFGRPTAVDESKYSFPNVLIMPGSAGTNWWKAMFSPAFVGDYNLDVAGGSEDNAYGVSFNYFDQGGTAAYNNFKRGSVRVNTSFIRDRLNLVENVSLALDQPGGGLAE